MAREESVEIALLGVVARMRHDDAVHLVLVQACHAHGVEHHRHRQLRFDRRVPPVLCPLVVPDRDGREAGKAALRLCSPAPRRLSPCNEIPPEAD